MSTTTPQSGQMNHALMAEYGRSGVMDKPININEKNAEKITAALLAANGRANSHTITCARHVSDIADAANDYLSNLGLSKACMVGAKVSYTSGDDVPNAYKWPRKVTHAHLERRKSGWFINSIEVVGIWGNAPKTSYLLTCEQDKIVVAKTRSAYRIIPIDEKGRDR